MRLRALLGLSLVALILAACGGTPTPPPPALGWVEISGGGFLLAGEGDSRSLTATAFNNLGAPMDEEEIAWETSDTSVVEVDQEGNVVAVATSGAAQITARVGSVRSSPVLVTVGGLAPGAVLLDDEEFTSEPEPVDPSEEFAVGSLFTVSVQDASSLSVGDIVVSSGFTPVIGRLNAVSGNTLTLEVLPIGEVFTELDLANQSFSSSPANIKLSSEAAEYFNSSRTASGAIRLEPKQDLTFTGAEDGLSPQQSGTRPFGPFECVLVSGESPVLSMSMGPFEYKENLTFESAWNDEEKKLIVHLQPELKVDLRIRATRADFGTERCRATLFESLSPFGGALGFYLGAAVPVGIGFEIGAVSPVANVGLEIDGTVSPKISAGFSCQGGDCESVASFEDGGNVIVRPLTPSLPDGIHIRHQISVFAFAAIEPGILKQEQNGAFRRTGLTGRLLIAEAGRELYTLFANRTTQALDSLDLTRAYYSAVLDSVLRAGSAERRVLDLLGLAYFPVELEIESTALGQSPETEISLGDIVGFDKGDRIPLTISTSRETLKFLGSDNIAWYEAFILTDDNELIQIARIVPPLGLTRSEFDWIATHDSDDLKSILVFVTSAFVPDQPIIGKSARIGQEGRLELVGTFELAQTGSLTTTENHEYTPTPEFPASEWKFNRTETITSNYQATVPVNAFYQNGDWTFMPQSWNASALSTLNNDLSVVYAVHEFQNPACYNRENTLNLSYSGFGIESVLGTIKTDLTRTRLQFNAPSVLTLGTSLKVWDWPCFSGTAGNKYFFEGPSGSESRADGRHTGFTSTFFEIFIDPTDPSTWVGSVSTAGGAITVSWNLILDLP